VRCLAEVQNLRNRNNPAMVYVQHCQSGTRQEPFLQWHCHRSGLDRAWAYSLGFQVFHALDISRAGIGEGGRLEGWLGCLLCLGSSERPCNTCIALPCICITVIQILRKFHKVSASSIHTCAIDSPIPSNRHPPPQVHGMRDMLRARYHTRYVGPT